MKKLILTLLVYGIVFTLSAQTGWQNVADKGADRTGKTKCTQVINGLIDKLSAAGGGTVYFPAGTYLTGPIMMKSNITLNLDAGAVVKFSDDFDD
jgi:polygalacturonase